MPLPPGLTWRLLPTLFRRLPRLDEDPALLPWRRIEFCRATPRPPESVRPTSLAGGLLVDAAPGKEDGKVTTISEVAEEWVDIASQTEGISLQTPRSPTQRSRESEVRPASVALLEKAGAKG